MKINGYIVFFVLCALLFIFYKFLFKKLKTPKVSSLAFCNGGIKCGKSLFSLYLAVRNYKRIHFIWKIVRLFKPDMEEPLLYSNIPLKLPYVPLTTDMLLRKVRFNYKSVIFIDEASLVADSRLAIDDKSINTDLLKMVKLIGHETHGGLLVFNSQSIDDMHNAFRRGLSQYFYVHHLTKWIPFFVIAHVRECIYAEDGSSLNVFENDIESDVQKVIIPKRYFKYYDSYAFSYETDGLSHSAKPIFAKSLKAKNCVSFRKEFNKDFNKEFNKNA